MKPTRSGRAAEDGGEFLRVPASDWMSAPADGHDQAPAIAPCTEPFEGLAGTLGGTRKTGR